MYGSSYPQQGKDSGFPWAGVGATAVGLGALAATPLGLRSALGLSRGTKALPDIAKSPIDDVVAGTKTVSPAVQEARTTLNRGLSNTDAFLSRLKKNPKSGGNPEHVLANLQDLHAAAKSEALNPTERLEAVARLETLASTWWARQPEAIKRQVPLNLEEVAKTRQQLEAQLRSQSGPSLRDSIP